MSTDKRMAIKPALNQFNGGEISPYLEGRYDWDKYNYSAKLCKNFIPNVEGYLCRRGGSHFVAEGVEREMTTVKFVLKFSSPQLEGDVAYFEYNGHVEVITETLVSIAFEIPFEDGEEITYSFKQDGCIPVAGVVIAEKSDTTQEIELTLIDVDDAVTLTIVPHPADSIVRIRGMETKTITVNRGDSVAYTVTYRNKVVSGTSTLSDDTTLNVTVPYILFSSSKPQSTEVFIPNAKWQVAVVGGGGGAGGGSTGDNHRSSGGGGGGGAAFVGVVQLGGNVRVAVGGRGYGGRGGRHYAEAGSNADSSSIGAYIVAGGGQAGAGVVGDKVEGIQGAGGILTLNITPISYTISSNGTGGMGRTARGGDSLYSDAGRGGNGVYQGTGNNGTDGLVEIIYYGEAE